MPAFQWFYRLLVGRKETARVLRLWARWQMRGLAPIQATEGLLTVYGRRAEAALVRDMAQALRSGHSVGDALRHWLPQDFYHRILAGEGREDFAVRLERIALDLEGQRARWSGSWHRLGYGIVLLAATAGLMIVVIHGEVLPAVQSLSDGGGQAQSGLLSAVASHLAAWWWVWPLATVGLLLAAFLLARFWTGDGRRRADWLPGLQWYRLKVGASLLRTSSLLVESGDTWSLAASRLAGGIGGYAKDMLLRLQQALAAGRGPAAAMQSAGWLSASAAIQLRVLEGDAQFPALAGEIAEDQAEEINQRLDRLISFLQLGLYLLAGLGLLLILSAGRALRDSGGSYFS